MGLGVLDGSKVNRPTGHGDACFSCEPNKCKVPLIHTKIKLKCKPTGAQTQRDLCHGVPVSILPPIEVPGRAEISPKKVLPQQPALAGTPSLSEEVLAATGIRATPGPSLGPSADHLWSHPGWVSSRTLSWECTRGSLHISPLRTPPRTWHHLSWPIQRRKVRMLSQVLAPCCSWSLDHRACRPGRHKAGGLSGSC